MKYVLILIATLIASYTAYISFSSADQTLLDKTIEHNSWVFNRCFSEAIDSGMESTWSKIDTDRYRKATDCWQSQRKLTPDDLFLTLPRKVVDSGQCSISQSEDDHVKPDRGWMYATDLACNFKEQGVYAPDYLDQMIEYKIESVWYDNLLGNFVILSFPDNTNTSVESRWYFGHTVLDSNWKVWDVVTTWVRFAHANISGATTGWHTHIELRRMYDGVWQSVRYVTRGKERKLEEKRLSRSGTWLSQSGNLTIPSLDTYYFTHYDLWSVNQNDESPCVWADWKDSCKLAAHWRWTMALTIDIRKKLGVWFWDKVALTGDVGCEWVYTITDEMACRFRWENAWDNGTCHYSDWTPTPKTSNIKRPWTPYYIKGDLPGKPGWACSIKKL